MTIFQIQCFLNVAEYLNFTEAANHLFVAQSSLSRNVSNLEEELGMKLFVRTKKVCPSHFQRCHSLRRIFQTDETRGSCRTESTQRRTWRKRFHCPWCH